VPIHGNAATWMETLYLAANVSDLDSTVKVWYHIDDESSKGYSGSCWILVSVVREGGVYFEKLSFFGTHGNVAWHYRDSSCRKSR
jgi:hypothetical protein